MKLNKFVLRDGTETTIPSASTTETTVEASQTMETVTPLAKQVLANATKAFSIVQVDGRWMVLELEVDVTNKQVGEWKLLMEDGSKSAAIERFKINVAETLM